MLRYGSRFNADMLNYYGFIDLDNPSEGLRLPLCLNADDSLLKAKQELLGFQGLYVLSGSFYTERGWVESTAKFMSYLRLIVYEGDVQLLHQVCSQLIHFFIVPGP